MKKTLIFLFAFFSAFLNGMEEEAQPVSISNNEQPQDRQDAFVVFPQELEECILIFLIEETSDPIQNLINILSNKDIANIKLVQKSWNLWIKNKIEKLLKKNKAILKKKWNHPHFPVVFPGESPEALAKETIKTLKSFLLFILYKYSNKFSMNEIEIRKLVTNLDCFVEKSLERNPEATELILKFIDHFDQDAQIDFYNRKFWVGDHFLILALKFNCKKVVESILNLFSRSLQSKDLDDFSKQLNVVDNKNNYTKKIIVVLICINVDINTTFMQIGNLAINYGASKYGLSMHGLRAAPDINNPNPIYAIMYLYSKKATESFINHISKLPQSEILWAKFGNSWEDALYVAKIFNKITL